MKAKLARRLVEPDYWTCPHGLRTRPETVLTYGPEVADLNAKIGFEPDPQQELCLDLIFAINPDGSPASFEVCLICCRQNLKTGVFKQAAIGWLFVTEQRLIVWSSHEMTTTNEAQRELGDLMMESPHTRRHMMTNANDGIFDANGQERIELANGQRILFKARTVSGGRGLAAPKLILDEAFALRPSMMGSLLPLMTAQVDPQVLYGSSAGKEDSEVLFDIRERGRNAMSPRMTYLEWLAEREDCADKDCKHPKNAVERGIDCALDREHLIRAGNPAITTGRIQIQTIHDLRQALPPEEYMRECLGWWADVSLSDPPVIDPTLWSSLARERVAANTPPTALAVDQWYDGTTAIGAAWRTSDGWHTEVLAFDYVHDPVAVIELLVKWAGRRITVGVAGDSPAASMIGDLRAAGVKVNALSVGDLGKACVGLHDDVIAKRLTHKHEDQLDAAVAGAKKATIGNSGLWRWDRRNPDINLTPLVVITVARFAGTLTRKTRTGRAT